MKIYLTVETWDDSRWNINAFRKHEKANEKAREVVDRYSRERGISLVEVAEECWQDIAAGITVEVAEVETE